MHEHGLTRSHLAYARASMHVEDLSMRELIHLFTFGVCHDLVAEYLNVPS
jgi:hypothetical protein